MTAAELGVQGERGVDRYAQKLATVIAQKPAYEAYDEGRKALADNRPEDAERLARKAIQLEPRESHFYALQGDIDLAAKRYDQAVKHFSDAQGRNDRFFYYPLQRGLTNKTLGRMDSAESDLKTSVEMLPTANAYHALGEIAESRGNAEQAKQYYAAAASNSSGAGQAAQDALVRLDMPTNPGRYMSVESGLDSQGQVIVQLTNTTRSPVGGVQLVIDFIDANGQVRQVIRQFQGVLPAGQSQQIATGLGPFQDPDSFRVRISQAAVATQ
jgi:tetratricopeptide (TPR) repeat protein